MKQVKLKSNVLNEYKNGMARKEVIDKYNISSSLLYKWLNENNIKSHLEEKRIREQKDSSKLKIVYDKVVRKNEILSKTLSLLPIDQIEVMKVAETLLDNFFLKEVAKVLNIPYATFYHHVHNRAKEPLIKKEDDYLKDLILKYFNESGKRLGKIKMYHKLKSNNIVCSQRRTSRLMEELNLKSIRKPKKAKDKTIRIRKYAPFDMLKQNFNQTEPNVFWCGDVSQFNINENKFFICVILDLFSRKVISHTVSCKNNNSLTINTFKDAFEKRGRPKNLTFHSDQGTNYRSNEYINLLHTLKVNQSFSKKGTPYDNSVVEAFFSNMKQDDLNSRDFEYFDELEIAVNEYVEYYNNFRPHRTLNHKTPNQFEEEYYKI